jgi:hypothetical protein
MKPDWPTEIYYTLCAVWGVVYTALWIALTLAIWIVPWFVLGAVIIHFCG